MTFIGFIRPLFILLVILSVVVLPLIALIDILRSEFKRNDKIIWVLVVILSNLIGTLLYFMIGAKQKVK
jgi:drug/metabolite transporter (DMT)-like permease